MALLQTFSLSYMHTRKPIVATTAIMHVPDFRKFRLSTTRKTNMENLQLQNKDDTKPPLVLPLPLTVITSDDVVEESEAQDDMLAESELYMILVAVVDRVEMHQNVMEQRNNWNILLFNSVNMLTLTATTMAGVAATGSPSSGLRLSSFLLFSAALGLLTVINKIQPSQLVEEQRNAARLFKQIRKEIEVIMNTRDPTARDVKMMMEKVLALDRAYPLPLIGTMLEKFPKKLKPSRWWPKANNVEFSAGEMVNMSKAGKGNGWDDSLEREMREIVQVMKMKDGEEYARLGNIALKVNKALAISGHVLTSIAAVGSAFLDPSTEIGSAATVAATIGGALACAVNSFEHGGQVGMVFEMYRNCAGFFELLEESIESTLEENEVENRENGEVFEMKVALKLGRSLSQLRELAAKSAASRSHGGTEDEYASKLF